MTKNNCKTSNSGKKPGSNKPKTEKKRYTPE